VVIGSAGPCGRSDPPGAAQHQGHRTGGRIPVDATTRNMRIATAVGAVMALHHVDQAETMDLLIRISDRTQRDLQDVADSVVDPRSLPQLRPQQ
jgi:hypothetical protein